MLTYIHTFIRSAAFKERLQLVENDLPGQWPSFRDEFQDALYAFIVDDSLRDSEDEDEQFNCLEVYTRCLEFMSRYPNKKESAHLQSVAKSLNVEARAILRFLWGLCQASQPLGRYPFGKTWVNYISKYLVAIFKIPEAIDELVEWEWDDEGTTPMLMIQQKHLTLTAHIVLLVSHCLLLSKTVSDRKSTAWLRRTLNTVGEYQDGEDLSLEYYYQSHTHILLNKFKDLSKEFVDADWQYEIIQDFLGYLCENAPQPLFSRAFELSVGILVQKQKHGCIWDHETPERSMIDFLRQPNDVLRAYKQGGFDLSMLDFLDNYISNSSSKFDAVELMVVSTLSFAVKYRIVEQWISRDKDGREIFHHELFLVPVIVSILHPAKSWKPQHNALITALAPKLAKTWKMTLDALRELVPEDTIGIDLHVLRIARLVTDQWCLLGSLIGVHRLSDSLVGCSYRRCPSFVLKSEKKIGICSACKRAQYCGSDCQTSDWKEHKRHCRDNA